MSNRRATKEQLSELWKLYGSSPEQRDIWGRRTATPAEVQKAIYGSSWEDQIFVSDQVLDTKQNAEQEEQVIYEKRQEKSEREKNNRKKKKHRRNNRIGRNGKPN